MSDRTELYKDKRGEFRWKKIAPNNRTVGASTEGYINKNDCIDNAKRNGVRKLLDKTKKK